MLLLTGKASLLPNLAEFLSAKLNASVDYFNSLANVAVSSSLNQEALQLDIYQMAEIIGEVTRDVLPESAGIDLLPRSINEEMAFAGKKPFLYLSAAILAVSFIPPLLQYGSATQKMEQSVRQIQSEVDDLRDLAADIEEQTEIAQTYESRLQGLENLVNSKFNWINFFSDLQQRLLDIEDVWLDDLTVNRTLPEPVETDEEEDDDDYYDYDEEESDSERARSCGNNRLQIAY